MIELKVSIILFIDTIKTMPIHVTTIKNITPITIGDTIEPKKIPNLCQSLFNGVNNLEFIRPKIKKTREKQTDHIFIS